jgi:hypothetical protein
LKKNKSDPREADASLSLPCKSLTYTNQQKKVNELMGDFVRVSRLQKEGNVQ